MTDIDAADLAKGVVAGLIGGAVATAVMTLAQKGLRAAMSENGHEQGRRADEAKGEEGPGERLRRGDDDEHEGSTATAKVAVRASRALTGKELHGKARARAATAVHWGFGTLVGGAFGAAAEALPDDGIGTGTLEGLGWGTGVWLLADEVAVPALGLSAAPWEQDAQTHAYGFVAHLVYGATLGLVTRGVRRLLDAVG